MRITLNGLPLHDLGSVVVAGQQSSGQPPEAPQRWVCRLKIRVDTRESSFTDNRSLILEVMEALRTPHCRLLWEDDSGRIILDKPITSASHNLPDDPNAWGSYRQAIEVEVEYEDTLLASGSMAATWQRTGSSTIIELGVVERVSEKTRVARFAPTKDQRESVAGAVTLRGRFQADPNQSMELRRASLLAQLDAMRAEIRQAKSGRLVYASIDKTVHVEDFEAEIDQAVRFIPWSLSVEWVEFPAQDGYAQAQFTVETSEDSDSGAVVLAFSGQIGADTEARATAKLAALRASVAPSAQWEPVTRAATPERVSDTVAGLSGGDGESFIKLSFADRYRKVTGDILEWDLRVEDTEDVPAGLIRTVYSGSVLARGGSDDAAWLAAVNKARELGDHKYQFRVGARETRATSQRQDGRHVVRVEFAYEYRRKGSRVYVEMTGTVSRQPFGTDTESVQGRLTAATSEDADAVYASLRSGWATMVRSEQKIRRWEEIGKVSLPSGTPVSGRERLDVHLEFSFEVAMQKASGDIAIRYEIDVESDYLRRERTTTVAGTVYARTKAIAESALDALLATMSLGSPTATRRTESKEQGFGFSGMQLDQHMGLAFSDRFTAPIEGDDAILESSLSEEIQCSGPRRVVAPTASSYDIVQTCGVSAGRRSVRGRVVALTETVALAWAKRQKHLPYLAPDPELRYDTPPELQIEHVFVPLQEGVARTGVYGPYGTKERTGVSAVQVSFAFSEWLPAYDPLA